MSQGRGGELEQRLNTTPSPAASSNSSSSSAVSRVFSTVSTSYSSEITYENLAEENENVVHTRAMPLVGCPRCFMYVMLSEADPKCPKCNTTSFLYFLLDENSNNNHN